MITVKIWQLTTNVTVVKSPVKVESELFCVTLDIFLQTEASFVVGGPFLI